MAITRIAEITNGTMSELKQEVYADTLEDLDSATLAKIFAEAERTCKFLPVPAELREMAGIGGDGEGLAAWDFLQKFIDTHVHGNGDGGYLVCEGTGRIEWRDGKAHAKRIPIPSLPDSIARAVRLCGGWSRFKEADDEQYTWLKKEFMAAIASYDATEMASNTLLCAGAASMVKQLAGATKSLPEIHIVTPAREYAEPIDEPSPRLVRVMMTDEQWEARRELLREQGLQALELERKSKTG